MIDDDQESDYVSAHIEADAQLLWSLMHNGKEFDGDAETLRHYMRMVARFDSQRRPPDEMLIDAASPRRVIAEVVDEFLRDDAQNVLRDVSSGQLDAEDGAAERLAEHVLAVRTVSESDAGDEARVDVLTEYIYGRSMISEPGPRHVARALLARIDAAAPQLEPIDRTFEIIDGPEAATLPDDSRIVHTGYYDDLPEAGARVVVIGRGHAMPPLHRPRRWIVLHRGVPLDGGYGPMTNLEQAERDGAWPYDQKGIT